MFWVLTGGHGAWRGGRSLEGRKEPEEEEGALQAPPGSCRARAPSQSYRKLQAGAGLSEGNTFTGKPQIIFKALLYKHIKDL